MSRIFSIVMVAFLIIGCTQFSLVEPGPVSTAGGYKVTPAVAWNKAREGKVEIWTLDGLALQAVRFFDPIAAGDVLIEVKDEKAKQRMPVFRADMRASEVLEFVVDSLSISGLGGVKAENLRPFKFGPHSGYRFDISYITIDGGATRGIVVGAIVEDKLRLIVYTGHREHYYERFKGHAERLFKSIAM